MVVGDQDHGRVALAVTIGLGGFGQPLHLVIGQILARAQIGIVGRTSRVCGPKRSATGFSKSARSPTAYMISIIASRRKP